MTYLTQPRGSRLCGQTVVAMLADLSLEESVKLFGHKRGTYTRELARACSNLGIRTGSRLVPVNQDREVPPNAFLNVTYPLPGRKTASRHWVLLYEGHLYDPSGPDALYPEGTRYRSFLEIGSEPRESWLTMPELKPTYIELPKAA